MTDEDMDKIFFYCARGAGLKINRPIFSRLFFPSAAAVRLAGIIFSGPGSDPFENLKVAIGPFGPVPGKSAEWNRAHNLVEAVLPLHGNAIRREMRSAHWRFRSGWRFNIFFRESAAEHHSRSTHRIHMDAWQWINFLASGSIPPANLGGGNGAGVRRLLASRARTGRACRIFIHARAVRRYSQRCPNEISFFILILLASCAPAGPINRTAGSNNSVISSAGYDSVKADLRAVRAAATLRVRAPMARLHTSQHRRSQRQTFAPVPRAFNAPSGHTQAAAISESERLGARKLGARRATEGAREGTKPGAKKTLPEPSPARTPRAELPALSWWDGPDRSAQPRILFSPVQNEKL